MELGLAFVLKILDHIIIIRRVVLLWNLDHELRLSLLLLLLLWLWLWLRLLGHQLLRHYWWLSGLQKRVLLLKLVHHRILR